MYAASTPDYNPAHICSVPTAQMMSHFNYVVISSTLKKPSKNYTCFILKRFGLFLIHLQSKNNATLGNSKPKDSVTHEITV